jgi:hypothetical protein
LNYLLEVVPNNQNYWDFGFQGAIEGRHYDMANFFFEKGVSQIYVNMLLEDMLIGEDFEAARYLLAKGADLNNIDPEVANKLQENV